jgi:hypothetical protein
MDTETLKANLAVHQTNLDNARTKEELAQVAKESSADAAVLVPQWRTWLASEYASDLSPAVQLVIAATAWEDGYSAGYDQIELHYYKLSRFARTVSAL